MGLWQEAYRTVEDVHNLIGQMKKPPKPSSMAEYYGHLSKIFWARAPPPCHRHPTAMLSTIASQHRALSVPQVADNKLFHAYSLARHFTTARHLTRALTLPRAPAPCARLCSHLSVHTCRPAG